MLLQYCNRSKKNWGKEKENKPVPRIKQFIVKKDYVIHNLYIAPLVYNTVLLLLHVQATKNSFMYVDQIYYTQQQSPSEK